jgi:hypothetical protein
LSVPESDYRYVTVRLAASGTIRNFIVGAPVMTFFLKAAEYIAHDLPAAPQFAITFQIFKMNRW